MMFPKPKRKKKRKKHKASILHSKDGTCYLCMLLEDDYSKKAQLHEHHIFGGPNRRLSEAEGLKVYLCPAHHTNGPAAVHSNHEKMRLLQEIGQIAYEQIYTRKQFMDLIGRNFLDDEQKCGELGLKKEPGIIFLDDSNSEMIKEIQNETD